MRFVLASSSPARLRTLRRAGIEPTVLVPGVDEDKVSAPEPKRLAAELARVKAEAVLAQMGEVDEPTVLVACDSLVEMDSQAYGKPGSVERTIACWQALRGRSATLHTGHQVWLLDGESHRGGNRVASTIVHFADLSDAEIRAYAATGEPVNAAGGFCIDALGGAFITSIEGDHHNVVGISLPLLRQMLLDLGVEWHELWTTTSPV